MPFLTHENRLCALLAYSTYTVYTLQLSDSIKQVEGTFKYYFQKVPSLGDAIVPDACLLHFAQTCAVFESTGMNDSDRIGQIDGD